MGVVGNFLTSQDSAAHGIEQSSRCTKIHVARPCLIPTGIYCIILYYSMFVTLMPGKFSLGAKGTKVARLLGTILLFNTL